MSRDDADSRLSDPNLTAARARTCGHAQDIERGRDQGEYAREGILARGQAKAARCGALRAVATASSMT